MIEQNLWPVVPLLDLIDDMQPGFARRPNDDTSGTPQLRTNNVSTSGELDLSDIKYIDASESEIKKYSVKRGDVIFNNTNSPELVGKTAYFDQDDLFLLSNHMTRVRPNLELMNPNFLARYLHYLWQTGATSRWAKHWVNQAAVDQSGLARFKIIVPPLPEQERIVEILRRADEVRQLRRRASQRAADLLPALFQESFGSPADWQKTVRLGDLVDFVGGGTPSRKVDQYFTGRIPWATSKDIKARYLTDAQEHITEDAIANSATKLVPANTILIVVKSKILVHSLPMGITTQPFCFGQDLKGMVCKEGIEPQFIVAALQAQEERILNQARGVNTEGLTLKILNAIPVPDVGAEKQSWFVKLVNQYDQVDVAHNNSTHRLDELQNALVVRAFSGELTRSWRDIRQSELLVAASERDRLLGIRRSEARSLADLDLSDELGRTQFENALQNNVENIAKSVSSYPRLMDRLRAGAATLERNYSLDQLRDSFQQLAGTLMSSYVEQFAEQMAGIHEQYQSAVAASVRRTLASLDESQRQAFAGLNSPSVQELVASISKSVQETMVIPPQTWKLLQIYAEQAALLEQGPSKDDARYPLLSALSKEQYKVYLRALQTDGYFTPQMLAESADLDPVLTTNTLDLLVETCLLHRVEVDTYPDGKTRVPAIVLRQLGAWGDHMQDNDLTELNQMLDLVDS